MTEFKNLRLEMIFLHWLLKYVLSLYLSLQNVQYIMSTHWRPLFSNVFGEPQTFAWFAFPNGAPLVKQAAERKSGSMIYFWATAIFSLSVDINVTDKICSFSHKEKHRWNLRYVQKKHLICSVDLTAVKDFGSLFWGSLKMEESQLALPR